MTQPAHKLATHNKLDSFLEEHDVCWFDKSKKQKWNVSLDLANAIIFKMGGSENFLAKHNDGEDYKTNDLRSVVATNAQIEFFNEKKADFIDYVKRCADKEGVSGAVELINNWSMASEYVDMDTIAAALYEKSVAVDTTNRIYNNIYAGIVANAISDMYENFTVYLIERATMNALKAPSTKATQIHLDKFLASHESGITERHAKSSSQWAMNIELAQALVARLDKNFEFLDNYSDVLHKEDYQLNGFYFASDALGFYDDNKANLLDSIMRRANKDVLAGSVIEVIQRSITDATEIGIDEVAQALYEPAGDYKYASCHRSIVCMHIARSAAAELCTNFVKFMQEQQEVAQ